MTILGALAVLLWAVVLVAVASMLGGNPTAINGVVGGGFGAVVLTICAWVTRER